MNAFSPSIFFTGEANNDDEVLNRGSRDGRDGTSSYFFDFGDDLSPTKEDYTRILPEDRYDSETGFGLLSTGESYYVTKRSLVEYSPHVLKRSWVFDEYADDLTVDGVRSEERVTFKADLPNGSYSVRTWIGDLEKAVYSTNISYNGEWLVEGAAAFHTVHRSIYFKDKDTQEDQNYGCAFSYTRDITITDGSLVINVTGNDTSYKENLTLELEKNPPFSYGVWMSTGNRKFSTGTGPWRNIGGNFTNASVLGIEIIPVPYLPITGEVGSLQLDENNVTDSDLTAAVDFVNEGDWEDAYDSWSSAVEKNLSGWGLVTLAQVGMYLTGTLHLDLEFSILPQLVHDLESAVEENPRDLGIKDLLDIVQEFRVGLDYYIIRGISEPGAREQKNHFYESNKGAIHLWRIEPHDPLYPKAQLWSARALYSLDPHRWTSASGTARDIMESLRPLDPDNPYISFYLDTTRDEPRTWENGTQVISTIGEEDIWYLENYIAGFEGAPEWAKILREELSWLYDITDWWVDHKQQPDGSIGGGWTDDVEMIGLFGFDALISEGADDKSLEGAGKFVDGMLASGQVDMDKGFSAAFADTEHSAELTGDSLPMMVAVDFGNPYWIEFSMKTAALMRDLWMGENEKGYLQFKANHLSAKKIGTGGQGEDSWINFRAALPAWWVWWYSRDPEVEDLFVRWAQCWVNASMSTEKDKPEGVIPAMIGWPDGEIGGVDAPNWYQGKQDGSVNYEWDRQQYKSYITSLLTSGYEATGNTIFLEPLRLEAEIARDYLENYSGRDPSEGSEAWAGKILGQGAIDRYQDILDSYGLPGASEASELWNGAAVVEACRDGHDYIEKCYPLMTTEASATDRAAFIGIPNPFLIYTGGGTGGALLSPSYTYTGLGREFAAMVRTTNRSVSTINLYGFFHGDREAGLVPWALEPGAAYLLKGGPDTNDDGLPDSNEYQIEFTFSSRGMVVPFTLPGEMVYALEILKLENGSGWSLLPDPAWGDEPVFLDEGNDTVTVAIHNIGAAGVIECNISLIAVTGNETRITVATGILEDLQAPSNLEPSIKWIDLELPDPLPESEYYLLQVEPEGSMSQITTRNDERRLEPNEFNESGNIPSTNNPPTIAILKPGRDRNRADTSFLVEWIASDPDDDHITISLFHDMDTDPDNRKFQIATGLENTGSYKWNTSRIPEGEYYIQAVADDGNSGESAIYSTGTLIISHDPGGGDLDNQPPSITITEPESDVVISDGPFIINWEGSDRDGDDIIVSLYYDNDLNPRNGNTLIISRLANSGRYEWDLRDVREGSYYIYGVADDGNRAQATDYSNGRITIATDDNGVDTGSDNGKDDDDSVIGRIVLILMVGIVITLTILLFTMELWFPREAEK